MKTLEGKIDSIFKNTRKLILPLTFPLMAAGFFNCGGDKVTGTANSNKVENIPPETEITRAEIRDDKLGIMFYWSGTDSDGRVIAYDIALDGPVHYPEGEPWRRMTRTNQGFEAFSPGEYIFKVRSVDDDNMVDPSPATYSFNSFEGGFNKVVLPPNSPLRNSTFDVIGPGFIISTKSDEAFDLDLSSIVGSEIFALRYNNKPYMFAYVLEGDRTVELSAESTIVALAMMHPVFMNVPLEYKGVMVEEIRSHPKFQTFVGDLEGLLEIGRTYSGIESGEGDFSFITNAVEELLEQRAAKQTVEEGPYFMDEVGNQIDFYNPENIYYSGLITTIPDSFRQSLFLLHPKKGLFDINLFPPQLLASPTRRIHYLPDNNFSLNFYKGFSGNVSDNIDPGHPVGMATFSNTLMAINNILGIVSTAYSSDEIDLESLSYLGADNREKFGSFIENVRERDTKEAFLNITDFVLDNKDTISRLIAIKTGKFSVGVAEHLAYTIPIVGQVAVAIKVGSTLDKIPFFYDLVVAPSHVNYRVSQGNGVVNDYGANKPPDKPFRPHPQNGSTGIPLETSLIWSGRDPDGDPLTYKVYFEKNNSSPDNLLVPNGPDTVSYVFNLDPNSRYYWQVIANDGSEERNGDVWNFTTRSAPNTDSISTGKIAFLSNRNSSRKDIYTMNPDGSNVRLLANITGPKDDLKFSYDGRKLAFSRGITVESEIYVLEMRDQLVLGQVTYNDVEDSQPSWSPDGTKIVFHSNRDGPASHELYIMNSDGSNARRLTDNDRAVGYGEPSWSPDGREIAFEVDRFGEGIQIYTLNLEGSPNLTKLTDNIVNISPAWSRNGRKIAFASRIDDNYEIFTMNPDGSNKERLTYMFNSDERDPSWSPEGNKIVFASYDVSGEGIEIYVINSDGTGLKRLTNNDYVDNHPTWGP